MKKLLSFTLVAVMLLSTLVLSSCDLLDQAKDFVHEVLGIGDDVRTTINEEEWENALSATNFTVVMHNGDFSDYILMDGDAIEVVETTAFYSQSTIIDLEKGCLMQETENGWIGYQVDVSSYKTINLYNLGYVPYVEFPELVYNEETKTYFYENETKTFSARFEDGNLVYAELIYKSARERWVEIKNIGTTVVNLPAYEIITDGIVSPNDAPANAVTTVTDEQFVNMWSINNCTIDCSITASYMSINITFNITEAGMKMTLNYMGEESYQYAANVDGTYYPVEEHNGQYIVYTGQGASGIDVADGILQLLEIENVDETTLAYNEQGRYYTMQAGEDTLYFYFENGQINKIILVKATGNSTTPYLEIPVVFSNFGTTEVDLPEYIIDDEDLIIEVPPTYQGMVTEEQWDVQVNATINYTVDSAIRRTSISTGEFMGEYSTHFESAENGSYEFGHNSPYRAYLEDGVYNIDYNEETGTYEATKTSFTTEDFTICGQTLGVKYEYSDFTYNEYQGRYEGVMVVDDVEYQLFVYFNEYGTLVKIGVVAYMYEYDVLLEGDVVITSLGTTVVTLPEYVIIE